MKLLLLRSSAVAVILLVGAGVLWAQAGSSTASVEGQATDPNGGNL